ncbi:MAG: leucyl aminopeptidase [Nitrospirae bacterium]|nr:leucyl aminopeptidase [Nitrospirota bacterium]
MDLKVKAGDILKDKSDAAVLTAFEGEAMSGILKDADKALGGVISDGVKSGEFTGKPGEMLLLHTAKELKGGPARLLVVGLGKKDKLKADSLMRASGTAARKLRKLGCKEVVFSVDESAGLTITRSAMHWAQGALLGLYTYDTFKAVDKDKKEIKKLTLMVADRSALKGAEEGAKTGRLISESVCYARDMINAPANEMTPTIMAERAKRAAKDVGLRYKSLEASDCRKLGMGSFLAVAAGSVQPPKLITLEYSGGKRGEKPVVLVGKAITFDSGGISIKPVSGMEKMKYDMSGGAAVIGVMRAAAALKLPVNLVGLVPASENLPSGSAYKPGDVVRAMNGKTIEIISTDAEGRMVLADALCYSERYKPRAIIDIATLTGGCVVALGDQAIGLMGNDSALNSAILDAGSKTFERAWELPMWDEFLEPMKGDVSDLRNAAGREAQTITAGKFLEEFVPKGVAWAHLDIAGVAWEEKGMAYIPKGARGTGVRLLLEYLMAGA